MASLAKHFSLLSLLLISLFLSSHAARFENFNKVPGKTSTPEIKSPSVSESEEIPYSDREFTLHGGKPYGLYSTELHRTPATNAAENSPALPRNYNDQAYVTEYEKDEKDATHPEEVTDRYRQFDFAKQQTQNTFNSKTPPHGQTMEELQNAHEEERRGKQMDEKALQAYLLNRNNNNNDDNVNMFYKETFSNEDASLPFSYRKKYEYESPEPFSNEETKYYSQREEENTPKTPIPRAKQGMSDTMFLENGKYYYDFGNPKNTESSGNVNSFKPSLNAFYKFPNEFYNQINQEDESNP